jgi:hypothetical protein
MAGVSLGAEVLSYAVPGQTRPRPPRPPVVRIVVVGLLLFPLTVLAAYPIAHSLPIGWTTVVVVQLPTDPKRHGGLAAIHIGAHGGGRGPSVDMTSGMLSYVGDFSNSAGVQPGYITVDLRDMTYVSTRVNFGNRRPLTQEAMQAELRVAGVVTGSGDTPELASAVVSGFQKLAIGDLPKFDASHGPSTRPPSYRIAYMEGTRWPRGLVWWPWYAPWCVPVWLLAWVLLTRWLLRRHRRRLGDHHAGTTAG